MWKVSLERRKVAEVELIPINEDSMWVIAKRDDFAPSGSRTTSCTKGNRWNLGGPTGSRGVVTTGGAARGKTGAWYRAEVGSRTDSYYRGSDRR